MARPRIVHKIKNDSHGFYLRLRLRARKVMQLCFSDRAPDQQKHDSADRCRNQITPEIGTTSRRNFSKRKPPTIAPTSPTARLYNKPPRPPRICVASHPASNPTMIQAMTPMVFSRIQVRHESEIYTTGREMRVLSGSLPSRPPPLAP